MRRIEEVLRSRSRVSDSGVETLPAAWDEIRFENVSFGYAEGRANLESLSLSIRRGHTVAIVGTSGSGKSTILSLLMRLYDPATGSIRLGETGIHRIALRNLRARIGYVPQESFLFDSRAH